MESNVWAGDRPTGERKSKGKETLVELASLDLLMERKADKDGQMPAKPAATVLKSRLVHIEFDPVTMELKEPVPCLPPRIPVCTPAEIRKYMETPPDYANLKPEELVQEEKMTAEERELLALQKAEAERDAERVRLERVGQQREMQAEADQKAAGGAAVQTGEVKSETVANAAVPAQVPAAVAPMPEQLQKLLGIKNALAGKAG